MGWKMRDRKRSRFDDVSQCEKQAALFFCAEISGKLILEAESLSLTPTVNTVEWRDSDDTLLLIDQTLLPHQFVLVECRTYQETGEAIRHMKVRGAPAIGITAGFGMALAALTATAASATELWAELEIAANFLATTRPTAVNLKWAIDRCLLNVRHWINQNSSPTEIKTKLLELAKTIHEEDVAAIKRWASSAHN
jgi:methylthioribose-1-phosphate isomerase